MNDRLPALGTPVSSKTVSEHIAALHAGRQEFTKAVCSEKIKRALRHNVRVASSNKFDHGQKVYYYRNESKKWHGPGTVIGQIEKQVLIYDKGQLVRVHCSRVTLIEDVSFGNKANEPEHDSQPDDDSDNEELNLGSVANTGNAPVINDTIDGVTTETEPEYENIIESLKILLD